jgi:hypothetical protein
MTIGERGVSNSWRNSRMSAIESLFASASVASV